MTGLVSCLSDIWMVIDNCRYPNSEMTEIIKFGDKLVGWSPVPRKLLVKSVSRLVPHFPLDTSIDGGLAPHTSQKPKFFLVLGHIFP